VTFLPYDAKNGDRSIFKYTQGAFSSSRLYTEESIEKQTNVLKTAYVLEFYANSSNSIYGSSTTVQPKSMNLNILIKY